MIGAQLRQARIHGERFINLHEAAIGCGITPRELSDYEHNRAEPPQNIKERLFSFYKRINTTGDLDPR